MTQLIKQEIDRTTYDVQADNDSKIRWLEDIHTAFRKHGIGRALWNYKEKDFGFVDPSFESVKQRFIEAL